MFVANQSHNEAVVEEDYPTVKAYLCKEEKNTINQAADYQKKKKKKVCDIIFKNV